MLTHELLCLHTVAAAYIRARRVKEGRALQYALQPRPLQALLGAIFVSGGAFFLLLLWVVLTTREVP